MQKKKGISLIVLVITIIVMIILVAAVVITLSNTGIINRANQAIEMTNIKQIEQFASLAWGEAYASGKVSQEELEEAVLTALANNEIDVSKLDIKVTETGVTVKAKNNEEDFDLNWEFAYSYDREADSWSTKIIKEDNELMGDITVKFYKTGKKVKPLSINFNGKDYTFDEGDAYKLLIEGNGNLGALMEIGADGNPVNGYAWQLDTLMYMSGAATTCIVPYITEIVVGEGIKSIGDYAFAAATSLTSVIVSSKEEWNNVVIGKYNFEFLDATISYNYRTRIERLANEGWKQAYAEGKKTVNELENATIDYLNKNNVNEATLALYNLSVTTSGVEISGKETTLGNTILSAADFGKTVNYTANGIEDWKVLYKQVVGEEEYVYLIASKNVIESSLPTNLPGTQIEGSILYWDTTAFDASTATIRKDLWLANWKDYTTNINGECISYLLDEDYWDAFKNTQKYGNNVVGVIGSPTAEMIVASYNARSVAINDTANNELILTDGEFGYNINEEVTVYLSRLDRLYIPGYKEKERTRLATQSNMRIC